MKFHGEKLNKFRVMRHSFLRIFNFKRFQDSLLLSFFFFLSYKRIELDVLACRKFKRYFNF